MDHKPSSARARFGRIVDLAVQRQDTILIGLIVLVILLGVAYSVLLGPTLRFSDEQDYYNLARNLAARGSFSTDGVTPNIHRAPGLPLLYAPLVWLGAGVVSLRIFSFILFAGCIYLLHRMLTQQRFQLAATIAPVLVIAYPVLFYTAGTLYPQTLASFLLLLALFLLSRDRVSYAGFCRTGLVYGYLILTVPTFAATLLVIAIWFYAQRNGAKAIGITITVVVAIATANLWSIRNHRTFGGYTFVALSGVHLLQANAESTTATSNSNVDISRYFDRAAELGLDEMQRDSLFRAEAVAYMSANKLRAARMYVLKLLNYFNYRNDLATASAESSAQNLVMLMTYGPLLLLLALRLLLARTFPISRFEGFLIIVYLTSALAAAVFTTRIRYRLPFDFLLIAVVAIFLERIVQRWLSRPAAAEPAPAVATGAVFPH